MCDRDETSTVRKNEKPGIYRRHLSQVPLRVFVPSLLHFDVALAILKTKSSFQPDFGVSFGSCSENDRSILNNRSATSGKTQVTIQSDTVLHCSIALIDKSPLYGTV